jgi:diguanylate cyclase (GGDEF)-like protein
MSLADLLVALWPGRHPRLLALRRAAAIAALTFAFAGLFALLTLAWIAVDAAVFERPVWLRLALARIATSAAFGALAYACREPEMSLERAWRRLGALFAIPAAFFLGAQEILRDVSLHGIAGGVAAAYTFVPYVLAAGIAAFPLTAIEAAGLALFTFALEGWGLGAYALPGGERGGLNAFWLLFLIAGAAGFAGMSQVRLMAALILQATRDPLTGCLRRESGRELLEIQYRLAERRGEPLAVLFADLDRFKDVNDTWGHDLGDQVLATAATSLREASRESDIVLRWGGEEFVVILPGATGEEALALVGRLRERGVARLPDERAMTLSIGIAERIADATPSAAALVALADRRMYLGKQAGRNRCVHSPSGDATLILRD